MISGIARRLPDLSMVSILPIAFNLPWISTLANWLYALRKAVPAKLPLMPMFANTPSEAATLRMSSPAAAACGPAILSPSDKSIKVCAELFAVAVKISTTFVIRETSISKTRILLAAISAACPKSVPVALAKFKTAPIVALICIGLKPIRASEIMPSAASFAINEVSRPRRSAVAVNTLNSSAVALLTALTMRMASSKSANFFVANANGVASMVETPTIFAPIPAIAVPKD